MNKNDTDKTTIRSFRDLHVYQGAYHAMLIVHKELLPQLPPSEKYDLRDQLSRSTKAVPRLIAEGYSKKHQIEQSRDLYGSDKVLCNNLIDRYDKVSRQLFNLAEAWDTFKQRRRQPQPQDDTRVAAE